MNGMARHQEPGSQVQLKYKWASTQFVQGGRIDPTSMQLLEIAVWSLKVILCLVLPLHHHHPLSVGLEPGLHM